MEHLFHSQTERRPEVRYKMRELIPKYYMMLGALAAVQEAETNEWRQVYSDRLGEIETEIREVLGGEADD